MNRPRQHKYANPLPRWRSSRSVFCLSWLTVNAHSVGLAGIMHILYLGHLLLGVPSVHMKNRLSIFARCFVPHRCDKHVHVVTLLRRGNFVRQGKRRRSNEDAAFPPKSLPKLLNKVWTYIHSFSKSFLVRYQMNIHISIYLLCALYGIKRINMTFCAAVCHPNWWSYRWNMAIFKNDYYEWDIAGKNRCICWDTGRPTAAEKAHRQIKE